MQCARFGGEQRFVADYLTSEVLEALDDVRRDFLQGIAVLGQFTPALCDAVLNRTDSDEMIADLERSSLFVSRLELGPWFQIHPLFAEYAPAQAGDLQTRRGETHPRARSTMAGPSSADRGNGACGLSRRFHLGGRSACHAPPCLDAKWCRPHAPALGANAAR